MRAIDVGRWTLGQTLALAVVGAAASPACDATDQGTPAKPERATPEEQAPSRATPTKGVSSPEPAGASDPDKPTTAAKPIAVVAPDPDPEPVPAAKSAFDEHVASLGAPATEHRMAHAEPPDKRAWTHYKAQRYAEAVREFGAAAVADPKAWKHPFNMACAAAKGGDERSAQIALTEAMRRNRSAVQAKAAKDEDLASLRSKAWFSGLMAGRNDYDIDGKCEKLVTRECWDGLFVGAFDAPQPIAFDTALSIEVPEPGPRPKSRYARIKKRVDRKAVAKTLGLRGVYGIAADACPKPAKLEDWDEDMWPGGAGENCVWARPGFWWPTDDEAILVIPHTQRLEGITFRTATIARRVDGVWMATTLQTATAGHLSMRRGAIQVMGVMLRPDGVELLAFGGLVSDDPDESEESQENRLCRVAAYDGVLKQTCADNWKLAWDELDL